LGIGWKDSLVHFDPEPLAAASIGQVHLAKVTDPDDPANVLDVCMKIQYPGVAKSIHSDIDNLMRLVSLTDILPKGLYVEHAVAVAKEELTLECDYEYERDSQIHMANLLRGSFIFIFILCVGDWFDGVFSFTLTDDPHWHVPRVIPALCAKGVITTEYAPGVAIDNTADLPQDERDYIGTQLLRVTLRELFEFRFMQASFFFILVWATKLTRVLFTTQTDPNFANFLYDSPTRRLTLIDFGAAKEFPKQFVDDYMRMVVACAERDRETLIEASIALGFLTGDESPVLMVSIFLFAYTYGR
jgi:aarF domain-containing kinase